MDIQRPDQNKAKRKKHIFYVGIVVFSIILVTIVLNQLKAAAPTVERNSIWIDTVKRGEMLRQVRGLGTLVPEEIRWIAARTKGRVDRIVLRPGASVEPGNLILVLANPDVVQAAFDADSQLQVAEAELVNLRVQLESSVLQAESTAANARADYEQSKLRAEVNSQLFQEGLVSQLELKLSQVTAGQAATRNEIEQKRYHFAKDSIAPQLAIKKAEADRLRSQAKLRHDELDALNVIADMAGVLQILPVEVGAQVQPGDNLARVADPARLKAEIRVAETQAKDILVGQKASIDTRNGIASGRVSRIDPSVQNGTVSVDVIFDSVLPKGARPDLSIDGIIELERLEDVVYIGRPAFGKENSTVGLFKLDATGSYATRVQIRLGLSSVNSIEVIQGLQPSDRVILSDMSRWDAADRIRLQ